MSALSLRTTVSLNNEKYHKGLQYFSSFFLKIELNLINERLSTITMEMEMKSLEILKKYLP